MHAISLFGVGDGRMASHLAGGVAIFQDSSQSLTLFNRERDSLVTAHAPGVDRFIRDQFVLHV